MRLLTFYMLDELFNSYLEGKKRLPNVHMIVYMIVYMIFVICTSHPSISRHWARPKQSTSSQSPVEEVRVAGCTRQRQCLIMTLWMVHGVPVIDNGPKIQWVTFLRFSLFQNPGAMSLEVDKHFRSLTNMWKVDLLMNCFKVYRLFEHEGYSPQIHSWSFGRYLAIIT